MAQRYTQPSNAGATRFSKSPVVDIEYSRMTSVPKTFTTFNAGRLVPIRCFEVLPHDTYDVSLNFVSRLQSAVIKPTFGTMQMDIYAFFVPNRIVNDSWKNVYGENTSGYWTAPEVELAPLYPLNLPDSVQIAKNSVADYYGLPTQKPIPGAVLSQMTDTIFKGYLSIWNEKFRDQNYQPPISFSKLNVYNGFLMPKGTTINMTQNSSAGTTITALGAASDGSYPGGAVLKEVYGEGQPELYSNMTVPARLTNFSANGELLRVNKLHDAYTSVLPSPQKGPDVYVGLGESAPVNFNTTETPTAFPSGETLKMYTSIEQALTALRPVFVEHTDNTAQLMFDASSIQETGVNAGSFTGWNVSAIADLSQSTGISINDLRLAVATKQIYEQLGRSGSRYISVLRSFFGLEVDNPFEDIPTELGHIRRELDLFQVAQTSASQEGTTAQGDLAAFGFTDKGGHLFTKTFLEHGFVHIFACVRHKNVYTTEVHPHWFRKSTLDFYLPQLANISEQPIRLATLNPFKADSMEKVLGYQEAWYEYRYDNDVVNAEFRTGINNGLDIWTYADSFDEDFDVVDGEFLYSNSQEVLDRTLAVTSAVSNQFLAVFAFNFDKQRPMPTYSVPGIDTI